MSPILILTISAVLSTGSFLYALFAVVTNKAPLYFKMLIAGIGCYALQDIHILVAALVGDPDKTMAVASIAVIGCFTFLTISNQGEVDNFVDDGGHKKEKLIALTAPIALVCYYLFFMVRYISYIPIGEFIVSSIECIPAAFAVYYALKHLLLPLDDMGFLKSTRLSNLTMLIFIAVQFAYTPIFFNASREMLLLYYIPMSASAALFAFACVKGVKIWKTSI